MESWRCLFLWHLPSHLSGSCSWGRLPASNALINFSTRPLVGRAGENGIDFSASHEKFPRHWHCSLLPFVPCPSSSRCCDCLPSRCLIFVSSRPAMVFASSRLIDGLSIRAEVRQSEMRFLMPLYKLSRVGKALLPILWYVRTAAMATCPRMQGALSRSRLSTASSSAALGSGCCYSCSILVASRDVFMSRFGLCCS